MTPARPALLLALYAAACQSPPAMKPEPAVAPEPSAVPQPIATPEPPASHAPAPVVSAEPPPAPRPLPSDHPKVCAQKVHKCFPPHQLTSGGKVLVPANLRWDAHGCLPKAQTGGACAAFFPTSEPRVESGQCCYDGCPGEIIKCGRPLLLFGKAVVAQLLRDGAWSRVS